jgi:hypothetical protein
MVPNVVRVWREQGETDCTCCRTRGRSVYTQTPDGGYHELCWPCWRAKFSALLRHALEKGVRAAPHPVPKDRYALRRKSIRAMHTMALEAVRLRLYVQPVEARASGLPSLEGAIRANCAPLKWAVGIDPILDMTISKVLPKDQRLPGLHPVDEEAA